MTQYMFLLFDDEKWYDEVDQQSWQDGMKLHGEFAAAVEAAGASILGGAALQRSTSATTVRNPVGFGDQAGAQDKEALVTDGPFIETKEALGGFYLIDAKDLDQALALAKLCPSGNVEVRPVMETGEGTTPPA